MTKKPEWTEYVDACVGEIKAGCGMSISEIHDGLIKHFAYPHSYSTVRDYIYRTHGKPKDW